MSNLEKMRQLEHELESRKIDALLILSREDSDTVLPLLLPVHVVAQTAFFFCRDGSHIVLTGKTDANMYSEFGIFEIITCREPFEVELKRIFDRLKPDSLALNISEQDYLSDGLTLGQYQMLQDVLSEKELARIECSSQPLIQVLRSVKTSYEQECIRTAVEKTCAIYSEVAAGLRSGMSETDIGELFVEGMKRHGVVNAFDEPFSYPLICINRCGLAHRKPNSAHILQVHDILICDFSVSYKGYCSDIARSFFVLGEGEEEAPSEVLHAFHTTVSAVSAVIEGLRPGLKGYEADALGRELIEKAGYPTIRHSVGHQVGMKVHDGGTTLGPPANPLSSGEIREGEIYAIEPTVIQDEGKSSFIVEENVLVKADSVEVFSERQMQLLYIKG